MSSCLVVKMRDGSEKRISGARWDLEALRNKLELALTAGRREIVTFDLPTEGVMILSSWVTGVKLVEAIA